MGIYYADYSILGSDFILSMKIMGKHEISSCNPTFLMLQWSSHIIYTLTQTRKLCILPQQKCTALFSIALCVKCLKIVWQQLEPQHFSVCGFGRTPFITRRNHCEETSIVCSSHVLHGTGTDSRVQLKISGILS